MLNKVWFIAGLCFIIGMSILGSSLIKSRRDVKTLRIVGYAYKNFESDMVKWNLTIQHNCDMTGLKAGYSKLSTDITAFKQYLITNGIDAKEISIQPVTSNPVFSNGYSGEITSYNLSQNVFIISKQLDKIEKISLNPDFFADRGLLLQMSNLSYLYTKLPDMKKKLLGDATADALERAKEIASSAKVGLGKMREARAGVFQITEPYSTDVSDYGIYNTSTKDKSISVTITAQFELK